MLCKYRLGRSYTIILFNTLLWKFLCKEMTIKFSTNTLTIETSGIRLLLNSLFRRVSNDKPFRGPVARSARIYENTNGDFLVFTSNEIHVSHGTLLLLITDPEICRELRQNFS